MIELLKFLVGLVLGMSVPTLLTWLVFVYPYSDIALRRFWIGGATGLLTAMIVLVVLLVSWWNAWSMD